ncbi:MAG: co-chaperone GroES family protein [Candidatus Dojkabacteria bacterium]|nr:co-chaperone GroES family protein [Candidatus Dojkabacteria bacterium]
MFENLEITNCLNIKGEIKALRNTILVKNIERGIRKTNSGILIPDDNMKNYGIRPRWGQVYAVGKDVVDVKPGQYVLVEHGRWTRGIPIKNDNEEFYLHKIENSSILLVSDEEPKTHKLMSKF